MENVYSNSYFSRKVEQYANQVGAFFLLAGLNRRLILFIFDYADNNDLISFCMLDLIGCSDGCVWIKDNPRQDPRFLVGSYYELCKSHRLTNVVHNHALIKGNKDVKQRLPEPVEEDERRYMRERRRDLRVRQNRRNRSFRSRGSRVNVDHLEECDSEDE